MARNVSSLAAAVVIASALALGACGGGGGNGGGNGGDRANTGSDAKQTFIEQGDKLCAATTEKVRGLAGQAAEDPGGAVVAGLPAFEALSTDLKAIPPPAGDAAAAAILAEYDKRLEQFRAIAVARENRDVATEQQVIAQFVSEVDAFAGMLKAYGFKECGQAGA